MRTIAFVPCLALALASTAFSQATTTDRFGEDRLVPARPGEGLSPGVVSRPRIDWSTAVPAQPLSGTGGRVPEGFVPEAVSYDVATGLETYVTLPEPAGVGEAWVTGHELRNDLPEWQEAFGAPTAISSTSYPWSAQCRLFFSQTGGSFICSGTLVDAKTLLTAGHCVHEGNGGAWSTSVSLSPAWDGDDDAYGSANATSLHSYTGWTNSGDNDWDMGYVRFDRPLGFLTGWFGYGYNTSDSFYTGSTFNFAAYPGCNTGCFCNFAGCPNQLYYGSGTFDSASTHRLTANLTSWCFTGGMSGGGVYFYDGTNRFVHGANSTRSTSGCTIVSNTWTRMVSTTFDDLQDVVIPGAYSTTTLDLVAMDVNCNSSVRAGARLSSLDYLVGNASLVNPASATYDVDFYLSTNDFISTFDTLLQSRTFTWDFGEKSSVRITSSSSLPQIPHGTAPGSYWVGMILDIADGSAGNNDSSGWDAAPITVSRWLPNLPASFAFASSSGLVIDFESFPSYVASNRLEEDTLNFSSTSWVNYANLAPCLAPYRGNRCLELGNDPSGGSVTPDNVSALAIGINGQNGVSFVMDYMVADHGEETDAFDGVWISQDGDTWYSMTPGGWGPISPIGTGEWYSVRDVTLTGATPVNTDDNFYLAFVAQDNFPFAGADGVEIDDIRIHRPDDLTLTITNLVSPDTVQLHHSGGTPGSVGCISYSLIGGGPIPLSFGTLLMTPPLVSLPCGILDTNGAHTMIRNVPPGVAGTPIWFQTLEWPAWELSNGVDLIIK